MNSQHVRNRSLQYNEKATQSSSIDLLFHDKTITSKQTVQKQYENCAVTMTNRGTTIKTAFIRKKRGFDYESVHFYRLDLSRM